MAKTPTRSSKSWAACVYITPVDEAGEPTGPRKSPGEVNPLSLTLTEEIITIEGNTCETYGKTIASRVSGTTISGSMTFREWDADNLAKGLKGLVEASNRAASTLSGKSVTLGKMDEWVEIGAQDLSSVVVTDSSSNTLEEGVDYKVNTALGFITPLKASVAETTVTIDAESAAAQGRVVHIGAGASEKYRIEWTGVDKFTGEVTTNVLYKVRVSANGEINQISEPGTESEPIQLTLTPELPTGGTSYGKVEGLF